MIWFSKIHLGVSVFDSENQEKENLAPAVHKNSLKNYHKAGTPGERGIFKKQVGQNDLGGCTA